MRAPHQNPPCSAAALVDSLCSSVERTLHRMPNEEKSTATPSSREMIERFLKEKNAQLWIGHSTAFFKNAIKSPGWYD
jgi:hypothetical protein